MSIPKILVTPDSAQYTFSDRGKVNISSVDGPKYYSAGYIKKPELVNAIWKLNADEYSYFMAFYRRTLNYGANKFAVELILDTMQSMFYTCIIIPNKLHLASQYGNMYIIQAELLVLGDYRD